ncbi:MAG: response regulator [Lachnospiraceae bacterium]|nr:response regulator [Lachnospiraceae bacterium]
MNAIIVDNDVQAVCLIRQYAKGAEKLDIIGSFTEGIGALTFVKRHKVDLAIIDIGVNGLELGEQLKRNCPKIVLIFTADHEECAMKVNRFHAAAYLVKPYTKAELDYSIQTAILLSKRGGHRIFIKTFGYFDVFVDNSPIMFRSGKAKELLALLVDRQGGTVNTEQIICTLWEDRPNDEATQNLCCKTTKALKKELREHGIEELLVMNRSMKRVDTEYFSCDLYELLEEDELARKKFVGDYMLEYSWAEERMAGLSKYL